jgi:hypothetical protein
MNNSLQIIMCASTLRSLLVMPWIYRQQNFSYKISVRQKLHEGELSVHYNFKSFCLGRFCRYVVFSKPLLSSAMNKPSLHHKFLKWMVKASLVKDSVVNSTKKRRLASSNDDESAKKAKLDSEDAMDSDLVIEEESNDMDNATEMKLEIDEGITEQKDLSQIPDLLGDILKGMGDVSAKKPAAKQTPKDSTASEVKEEVLVKEEVPDAGSSRINDLLGDILQNMEGGNSDNKIVEKSQSTQSAGFKKRYGIVELVTEYLKKQRILVRSTNHGTDQLGEDVCVTIKSDCLPVIGAEVCLRLSIFNLISHF